MFQFDDIKKIAKEIIKVDARLNKLKIQLRYESPITFITEQNCDEAEYIEANCERIQKQIDGQLFDHKCLYQEASQIFSDNRAVFMNLGDNEQEDYYLFIWMNQTLRYADINIEDNIKNFMDKLSPEDHDLNQSEFDFINEAFTRVKEIMFKEF